MMDPLTWLILTIVGFIGAIGTMIHGARRPTVPGKSDVEVKAEEKATADNAAAVQKHDELVAVAKEVAEKKNEELIKMLEEKEPKLAEDGDALNEHLKGVGKDVRGG